MADEVRSLAALCASHGDELRQIRASLAELGDRMTRMETRDEGPAGTSNMFAAVSGLGERMGAVERGQEEQGRILTAMRVEQQERDRALASKIDEINGRTLSTRQLVAYLSGALAAGGTAGGAVGSAIMRILGG